MDSMRRLIDTDAVDRLWARDASLFGDDPDVRASVSERLGWLTLPETAEEMLPQLAGLSSQLRDDGVTDVVLLGMGGSSLAPLVLGAVLGGHVGQPRLHVLDTTSPVTVSRLLSSLHPETTDVLVSSKSGTTIEPLSLYSVFRAWSDGAVGREDAGRRYRAVTDPGTPLVELAVRDGFREVFLAPPEVGGRFSALSVFGLVPAAMLGLDVAGLVARAREMTAECRRPAGENPGASLGAFMADAKDAGRDKLTIVTSPAFDTFGLWAEQLIAESTGKHGTGLVPVLEHEPATAPGYGGDRAVIVLRTEDDAALRDWAGTVALHTPVADLVLGDDLDLGREFVRWEVATALAGMLLGIDPFDQPDVARAKDATSAILSGASQTPSPDLGIDDVAVTYAGGLEPAPEPPGSLASALRPLFTPAPGEYIAVLAYLPDDDALLAPLRLAVTRAARTTGAATCLELGPRYLHSTGQLHKGGPPAGRFLVITTGGQPDVPVPGRGFDLAGIFSAQASGDLVTLARLGRPTMRVELPAADAAHVGRLADAILTASRGSFTS